jgi:hypothetical protein
MNDKDIQFNALIQQMAQQHQPELPSAGVIWWRARIQKKFAEKERIERPLVIMRMLAGTVGLVVVAWLVVNYRGQFSNGILPGVLFLALLTFGSLGFYIISTLRESKS